MSRHQRFNTLLLCACVYITLVRANVPELVYMNVTGTPRSLEGRVDKAPLEYNILMGENVSRFEAQLGCQYIGDDRIVAAPSGWIRWKILKDTLAKNGYHSNLTFWDGRYRPYFHIESWINNQCWVVPEKLTVMDPFDQCAVIHWESTNIKGVVIPQRCDATFPFICERDAGVKHFDVYEGYILYNLSSKINRINDGSQNIETCSSNCQTIARCSVFLYDDKHTSCTLYFVDHYTGIVNFTFKRYGSAMLGFKKDCNVTLTEVPLNVPYETASLELPTCGYFPIPDNYCHVGESQSSDLKELDSITSQLVQKLAVPVKSTSKYQRRFISAPDKRSSSVSMGAVGLILIVSAMSLLLCADVFAIPKKRRITITGKSS